VAREQLAEARETPVGRSEGVFGDFLFEAVEGRIGFGPIPNQEFVMTESPSVPATGLFRAWATSAILLLGLMASACGDLPVETSHSQVELDAPETVELMAEVVASDESEPGSTLCQALVRHLDRVRMELAAGAEEVDQGVAHELDAVIQELCG
jgi:hypothetical protein